MTRADESAFLVVEVVKGLHTGNRNGVLALDDAVVHLVALEVTTVRLRNALGRSWPARLVRQFLPMNDAQDVQSSHLIDTFRG